MGTTKKISGLSGPGRIRRMFKRDDLDFEPFESKVCLASPTMHGDEQKWVDEAIQTNI